VKQRGFLIASLERFIQKPYWIRILQSIGFAYHRSSRRASVERNSERNSVDVSNQKEAIFWV
jgi:hypothetical protein